MKGKFNLELIQILDLYLIAAQLRSLRVLYLSGCCRLYSTNHSPY